MIARSAREPMVLQTGTWILGQGLHFFVKIGLCGLALSGNASRCLRMPHDGWPSSLKMVVHAMVRVKTAKQLPSYMYWGGGDILLRLGPERPNTLKTPKQPKGKVTRSHSRRVNAVVLNSVQSSVTRGGGT